MTERKWTAIVRDVGELLLSVAIIIGKLIIRRR
jgi:hypothetical protein